MYYIAIMKKIDLVFNSSYIYDFNFIPFQYDHLEFPGVVPRSFIGPIIVGVISKPIIVLFQSSGSTKFTQQYIGTSIFL